MSASQKIKTQNRSPLFIAFFTIFLDLLGFGMIIPVLPFYMRDLGASASDITMLGAAYSLMQFVFAPFWGRLSDRLGRRPIMLFSIIIACIGHLLFGLAGSLGGIFASRLLAGFGNANIGTAQAIISDSTTPQTRAKGMGMIGAAFGLGFILGPAFGGVLAQWGASVPAYGAALLCFINFAYTYLKLPETLKPGRRVEEPYSWQSFKRAWLHPNVAWILGISFFASLSFSMMEQTTSLIIDWAWPKDSKHSALLTAIYLMGVGVTATLVQGFWIGRLSKRFAEIKLMRVGCMFILLGLFLIPILAETRIYTWFLSCGIILAFGSGLLNPTLSSFLSKTTSSDEQGGVLGLNQGVAALGRVVGPASAGFLYEWSRGAPFYLGAIVMLFPIFFTVFMRSRVKAE